MILVASFRQYPLGHDQGRASNFLPHRHHTRLNIRMDGIINISRPTTLPLVKILSRPYIAETAELKTRLTNSIISKLNRTGLIM